MRYRPGHGDPLGIAHVPDVPIGVPTSKREGVIRGACSGVSPTGTSRCGK
jgi:hypothetical protein